MMGGTTAEPIPAPMRIFVSHSHQDDAFGQRLVHDLRRSLGSADAVWYDAAGGLRGGDQWWRKIVAEIQARPVFVVVLSPDSMASQWVNDEIDLAWQLKNSPAGKTIIPVLYRPCEVRADLKLRQYVSFVAPRPYERAFAELLTSLGIVSVPETIAVPVTSPLPEAPAPDPIATHGAATPPAAPASPATSAPASTATETETHADTREASTVKSVPRDLPTAPLSSVPASKRRGEKERAPRNHRPARPAWRSARSIAIGVLAAVVAVSALSLLLLMQGAQQDTAAARAAAQTRTASGLTATANSAIQGTSDAEAHAAQTATIIAPTETALAWLKGYSAQAPGCGDAGSEWTFSSDTTKQCQPTAMTLKGPAGQNGQQTTVTFQESPWTGSAADNANAPRNYEIDMDVGNFGSGTMLIMDVNTGASQDFQVILEDNGNWSVMWSPSSGSGSASATTLGSGWIALQTWNTVTVKMFDNQGSLWLDGARKLTFPATSPTWAGPVAYTLSGSLQLPQASAAFRKFVFKPLT